jgi:DNA-binding FadR family transcriptional regulator
LSKRITPAERNNEALQPIVDIKLSDAIQQRLKEYISRNQLQPGDKLPTEEKLAKSLGVSRTAVREALGGLETLGIVEVRQGFGRVVREFSFDAILKELSYGFAFHDHTVLQMLAIRKALDAYFIEEAIANVTGQDLETLTAIVQRMVENGASHHEFTKADHAFHALIFQCAKNPLALQLFEITWNLRLNALDQQAARAELPPGTAHEHIAILAAIKQCDAAKARELLLAHHWNIEQRFQRQIAARTSSGQRPVTSENRRVNPDD